MIFRTIRPRRECFLSQYSVFDDDGVCIGTVARYKGVRSRPWCWLWGEQIEGQGARTREEAGEQLRERRNEQAK